MDHPEQSYLHTAWFLVLRGQGTGRWKSRGTDPKIWS